ncbi:hypothetical protein [Aliikangiella maris]|uniref:Uncharacterized protein n=2 Tax=Aliikangiella maris TaxID=3162458 RepID=A0ABV2BQG2_9GAMM
MSMLMIDTFIISHKKIELLALHHIYLKGSGNDDGAIAIIAENPQRYSDELIKLLKGAKPGSDDEEMALDFIEIVLEQPGVRDALIEFGASHPVADTKCLVEIILSDEPTMEPIIDNSGNIVAYKFIASRFDCKSN